MKTNRSKRHTGTGIPKYLKQAARSHDQGENLLFRKPVPRKGTRQSGIRAYHNLRAQIARGRVNQAELGMCAQSQSFAQERAVSGKQINHAQHHPFVVQAHNNGTALSFAPMRTTLPSSKRSSSAIVVL